ncbi:phosphoribosyltransferase [Myroides marinus]|uniref:phosphoribosyltransferase family protein n=1 Tax=Myroides marinus TaxID=703342 RepID=UPI0025773CB9|nr:phosphoribosyltransferase family protein [Myroides marinus]MDM1355786.1 phosphoribosyltransferase [Myroides marinus]MDM1363031.1 phosphoribosyltransferase [Myroides marinus]MDM1373535.1 phosphoribosyltransferase [Myroides marinus]MDM1391504.1 phosphoribosyltransferase [Myroides marinus]MDM1405624.1 phosphoribosyltransferase [Myroides marinus]
MTKKIILTKEQIKFTTKRIAYQIYETYINEEEIVIAGVANSGYTFAQKISEALQEISSIKVVLCEVRIDKQNPINPIETSLDSAAYKDKCVVLVDDVLNSGATLIYGVKHFLDVPLKKLKTAVLVDRNHKKYPVKADFKGISLSTSLLEHIQVVFDGEEEYAYLS